MKLSRDFTNVVNWALDNLIPPFIRDTKLFAYPLFLLLFKDKAKYFINFKEQMNCLSKSEITKYYTNLSGAHIQRPTDLNSQSFNFIMENLSGNKILDIACGRGYLAKKIVEQHHLEVTGIDFLLPKDLQSSLNPKFIKAEIEKIPFPDQYFDTVICTHTLEHVIKIEEAIKELRRVCNKKLIIVLPRQREYKYTFDLHVHFFPYKHSVLKILKSKNGRCINMRNDWVYVEDH